MEPRFKGTACSVRSLAPASRDYNTRQPQQEQTSRGWLRHARWGDVRRGKARMNIWRSVHFGQHNIIPVCERYRCGPRKVGKADCSRERGLQVVAERGKEQAEDVKVDTVAEADDRDRLLRVLEDVGCVRKVSHRKACDGEVSSHRSVAITHQVRCRSLQVHCVSEQCGADQGVLK